MMADIMVSLSSSMITDSVSSPFDDIQRSSRQPRKKAETRVLILIAAVVVAAIVIVAGTLTLLSKDDDDASSDDELLEYEWVNEDYGGLSGTTIPTGFRVSGYFSGSEYSPYFAGWNGYACVLDVADLGDFRATVELTVLESFGTEFMATIGLKSAVDLYDECCCYGPYYYTSVGEDYVGNFWTWIDNWATQYVYDSSPIPYGEKVTLGIEKTATTLRLLLNGSEIGVRDFTYNEYELFLYVAVKYAGTYADVTFENFSLER